MKNTNKTYLIIATIVSIIIIFCTFYFKNDFRRYKYEKYLSNEYLSLNLQVETQKKSKIEFDKPELAGIQDYYITIDPKLKRVPHEKLVSAFNESRNLVNNSKSDLYNRFIWNEVSSNMGGRIRSFMFDPNDSENNYKKVWAGSVTGGLWYNNDITDENSSWISVSDVWENLSISSITYDPNNTQVFYVGTGESQTAVTIYRESSTRGVGIWKTTDGGETWSLLTSTSDFQYISDIVVRNETGQSVVYAGVVSGTYQGEDHLSEPSDGIYRSTDGGTTWNQVLPNIIGQSMPYSPSDIEISATNRIFVGTYRNVQGYGGATILYSDNGQDWTVFGDYNDSIVSSIDETVVIPGRTILASSPSTPNTIYAVIAAGGYTPENFIYYRGRYMIKSTDNGDSWSKINLPREDIPWATLAWHALILKVDPNNENTVYSGGQDLYKSTDGGMNWDTLTCWYNYGIYYDPTNFPYVHADQHSITFKPGSSDTICFTSDGGAFITFNGTEEALYFNERSNSLNTLQFYTCDINPDSAKIDFIGGLQDNGTIFYKGLPIDKETNFVSGGDGAYCFIDNDSPGYYISTVYYNGIYVYRKNTSGFSLRNNIFEHRSGTFINPSDYDEFNNTLYANAVSFTNQYSNKLLRIKNITSTSYEAEKVSISTNSYVPFSNVLVSEYSTSTNTILLVGTQTGKLFKINNAQSTPNTSEIGSDIFPTANISCIIEGKSDNEILVTFSNYGVSSVWVTEDGGISWNEIEGNLPDMPIRWALFDPENPDMVLLATEVGIWATENIHDASVNWQPVINGLANVRVDMLRIRKSDNTILAATHGRGLYYCDLEGGTPIPTFIPDISISENAVVDVYPNPTQGIVKLEFNQDINDEVTIYVYNPESVLVETRKFNGVKKNQVLEMNLTGQKSGLYIITIYYSNNNISKKIMLTK